MPRIIFVTFPLNFEPNTMKTFTSDISGKEFPVSERVSARTVRHSVLDLIRKDSPSFSNESYLALTELNEYRNMLVANYLKSELGELSELEKEVLDSINARKTLARKLDGARGGTTTFGEKIADKVATFGGSWTFILSFLGFLVIWILVNVFWLLNNGFDPYPFILLNLILSCIAALQAPVIMMSQNRQEDKDRERSKNDYMVNLKSELEIRNLQEEIDHFILGQQQELMELQKVQIEMMSELLKKIEKKDK